MPVGETGELIRIIKDKILERGKIPFRDFMQMALYTDGLGYYTSGREIWGKKGDYITSPSLHHVFGKLISKQIFEMWEVMDKPHDFTIIEVGAGSNPLTNEILKYSSRLSEEFHKSLHIVIAERDCGKGARHSAFPYCKDIGEISGQITGCIISNELIDAFPVHIVTNDNSALKEVYVTFADNQFIETLDTLSDPAILEYLKDIPIANGQRIEVNLEVLRYIKTAANLLKSGFVITIDYGLPAKEFYDTFKNGGLLCYYRHKANDNPYIRIGGQDITSHVDFTSIARYGREAGLEVTGFTTQFYFLLALGILEEFKVLEDISIEDAPQLEWNQKLKELFMPGSMGSTFKVLIQHKLAPECLNQGGIDGIDKPRLTGFSYKDFKDRLI